MPTTTPSPTPHHSTPIGAIVGGAVGGVAVISAIVLIIILLLCRRRRQPHGRSAGHRRFPNRATPQKQPFHISRAVLRLQEYFVHGRLSERGNTKLSADHVSAHGGTGPTCLSAAVLVAQSIAGRLAGRSSSWCHAPLPGVEGPPGAWYHHRTETRSNRLWLSRMRCQVLEG